MAAKLFGAAQGLPWIKSLKGPNDDQHIDRLNHRYTTGFLLVCAALLTGAPISLNRITCWVPAQFIGAYTKYTENYCWISNTYYIPTNETVPNSPHVRTHAEIGYYQWTPFIFLLSALFFYLPRMLWRSMNTRSGIDIQHLIKISKKETVVAAIQDYCQPYEMKSSWSSRICRSICCTSGKRLGNYLVSVYLVVKLLYLINSLLQLILVQYVLGQSGWLYGITIWHNVFVRNSVLTDSPYFPRVTLCDLRIREVGNLHRYTVQCVLPINMLNEKLFALAWFWFIYVFIANFISFFYTMRSAIDWSYRVKFIKKLYETSTSRRLENNVYQDFTRGFLMQDGVLILQILESNTPFGLGIESVEILLNNFQMQKDEKKTTEPELIHPQDDDTV